MLWIKSFHIIFVVSWYAGLLYLPRLYVYHASTEDDTGHERFLIMERKLLVLMLIAAILASIFGFWLLSYFTVYLSQGWLHAKLGLFLILCGYHFYCWKIHRDFVQRANQCSHRWFRWFNEIPALILIAIIILVVVKPF